MSDDVRDLISEILADGWLARFVGLRENVVFEAKGKEPYDFSTSQSRYELAKDVSAMANADGGWIIVGLKTEKVQAEATDEVATLDLLPETAFPASRYRGIIREYVYPDVSELEVKWVQDRDDPELGVGVIVVPRQHEDAKPFLIAKVVDDGADIQNIVFGFVKRVGANSDPYTKDQLQRAMKQGMNTTAQRLSAIERKVDLLIEARAEVSHVSESQSSSSGVENVRHRIDQLLEE